MGKTKAGTLSGIRTKILSRLKPTVALGPKAWNGAALALLLCTVGLYLFVVIGGGIYSFSNGLANIIFTLILGALALSLGSLAVKLLGLIQKLKQPYRWILLGSLFYW